MDWLQFVIPTIASSVVAGALATWLRTRPRMKEVELQGEAALWQEIRLLKAEATTEKEECRKRIASLEAKVADVEHDLASETMNFDSFLLIAETTPERLPDLIPRIREDRRQHRERMALKKGAREGAEMAGQSGEGSTA